MDTILDCADDGYEPEVSLQTPPMDADENRGFPPLNLAQKVGEHTDIDAG